MCVYRWAGVCVYECKQYGVLAEYRKRITYCRPICSTLSLQGRMSGFRKVVSNLLCLHVKGRGRGDPVLGPMLSLRRGRKEGVPRTPPPDPPLVVYNVVF